MVTFLGCGSRIGSGILPAIIRPTPPSDPNGDYRIMVLVDAWRQLAI